MTAKTTPIKKKRPTWIPVVAAVIRRGDQVLLGQRPSGSSLPGVWEFPGGKIEHNETPEKALVRELQEELGIEAEIDSLMLATTHTYGETGIVLLFYKVNYWKGEPKTHHHDNLKWVQIDEIPQLELPDANKKIIPLLFDTPAKEGSN